MIKKLQEKMTLFKDLRKKFKEFFLKDDGGKKVINLKRVLLFFGPVSFLAICSLMLFATKEDSSFLGKTDKKIIDDNEKVMNNDFQGNSYSPTVRKVLGNEKAAASNKRVQKVIPMRINFKAAQVISRDSSGDPARSIPIGTNMIGKTLTAIDTREPNQMVKILLPYGGKSKMGFEIEKGTVLFGQVSYSGKGRKVSIAVTKGLTPDEREFDIDAQVLDPSNYSVGLVGESNSQADARVLSALGLSVVSGAAEIMVEREAMNGFGQTAPRPTIGNAALRGFSSSAQEEANRMGDKFKDADDYITLPAGKDVIVSLTKSYVEK